MIQIAYHGESANIIIIVMFLLLRCDGRVSIYVGDINPVSIRGMDAASIDYAVRGHATVVFTGPCGNIFHSETKKGEGNMLLLEDEGALLHHYHNTTFEASVHFEINRIYFRQQHKAIDQIEPNAVAKLLPLPQDLRSRPRAEFNGVKPRLPMDRDYQQVALERMLSTKPEVPHLVLGPFGMGKTRLIVAAALTLLQSSANRVLVCTHLNKGADSIYRKLQENEKRTNHLVLRLVRPGYNPHIYQNGNVMISNEMNLLAIQGLRAVVATYFTALQLKRFGTEQLDFTHILIDEGAQSQESEALGAFVMSRSSTKVIIVGDNKQVCSSTIAL